ncbi:MAG: sensor histidine kinase [Terriglobales bacterium]
MRWPWSRSRSPDAGAQPRPEGAPPGTGRVHRGEDWALALVAGGEVPAPPPLGAIAAILAPAWRELRRQSAAAQAERARLAAVLDGLDTAVMVLDSDGRLQFANRAAVRLWALDAARPGERPTALARIPELPNWLRAGAAARQTGRLELSDGRVLQLEVAPWDAASGAAEAGPAPASNSAPRAAGPAAAAASAGGVLVAARDITAVARLETMRRDFIAAVSHELRTPLTSVRGYAEMLQDELRQLEAPSNASQRSAPPAWQEPLDIIAANIQRLEKLAADLVTLSSIETGQYPFQFRRLDAAGLLAPAAAVLRPLAAERGAELAVTAAESGWVMADAEAIHRALLNLGENALLHGAAGARERGLRVEMSGRAHPDHYRLQVHDNGAGIGSMDQPHVFERFYRVDRSRTGGGAQPGGTGLGLALVKHIAQEHGGRVEMESSLGAGSTFAICLPLAPASTVPETPEEPHA